MRAGTHIDLSFWCKSRCFACIKRQVMSVTLRDLLFRSISRFFACKNHRWGLGPTDTSYSDARHAVLHAENHRWGLGPIDTSNCGHKVAVLNAQNNRWGLEPMHKTTGYVYYSGPEFAVLHAKTTGGVLDPQALVILACTKPEVTAGHKVAVLHEKNTQMRAGTNIVYSFLC